VLRRRAGDLDDGLDRLRSTIGGRQPEGERPAVPPVEAVDPLLRVPERLEHGPVRERCEHVWRMPSVQNLQSICIHVVVVVVAEHDRVDRGDIFDGTGHACVT
jgi:hypothetical protein